MDEKDRGDTDFLFMPKLNPRTAELKAKRLTNLYFGNGLNQARVGNKEGVSRQAINQRLKHLPVATPLQEALRKVGISTRYKAKKFKELLEAKRLQSLGFRVREVKDNNTRSNVLRLLCQVEGDIKENGNGKGVNATILIRIGNQSGLLSPTETSLIPHQRSEV